MGDAIILIPFNGGPAADLRHFVTQIARCLQEQRGWKLAPIRSRPYNARWFDILKARDG